MRLIRVRRSALIAAVAGALALAGPAGAASGGIAPGEPAPGDPPSGKSISGVSPSYAKFATLLADGTGLSLRVIGAWTLAEGGPIDNPLNIGPGKRYGTVRKGAQASADLLSQSLYEKVLASSAKPDGRQIRAIARSSWCPGCAGYEELLSKTYERVEVARRR